ncbi:unnamed protein product [Didymodactylos carnosus]|uniref:Uncharacterized protein n=1 Tax=Didymodactylos carnosus TaxID=1234261 RepID=A0A813QZQ4_9BILA|nr:unnamed protein product [Didymodactylos carnosus]CAF0773320.1 unnamed protein product [Didymodactylos carnosus]CAF3521106.1 unnamed protein product [Didymodactylos carnosus]CAF3555653.1 unnamed protein product [Didymodactylos carnosus]
MDMIFILFPNNVLLSNVLSTRTITEKEGHEVVLSCRFDQLSDKDRVMWSKDSIILSVNFEIKADKQRYEISGKYDLIVKNITGNDSGKYLCQNFDQELSIIIILTVLTRPSLPKLHQTNEILTEKSIAQFLCSTVGGNPSPTFSWYLNQNVINENIYTNASLSELRLPIERRYHGAQISCQVDNKALDKPLTISIKLNVQYKPDVSLKYGQSIVTSGNIAIIENSSFLLECLVDSNPSTIEHIQWLKNGATLTDITSPSLILQTIKRTDEGEYTCIAMNSIGKGQASIRVRIQYGPIVKLKGAETIRENQRLSLECTTDAYPEVEIYQWYKNNQLLYNSKHSMFIIDRVQKQDHGNYSCLAKNFLKFSNDSQIEMSNKANIRITIEYAPVVTSLISKIASDPMTDVIFQCQIDSYPESTINWIFNGTLIGTNTGKYFIIQKRINDISQSNLIVKNVQTPIDYGLYSCSAMNKFGQNSTTIQLRLKDIPDVPVQLNVSNISYSSFVLEWKPGFDGGSSQTFIISLNGLLEKQTNETKVSITNLNHSELYTVRVRAQNVLGISREYASVQVSTLQVPIRQEDLPLIEHATLHIGQRTISYYLNDNSTLLANKASLCIKVESQNGTIECKKIISSIGTLQLEHELDGDPTHLTVSICLDNYEIYCGKAYPVEIKRQVSFNWLFVLIASVIVVFILILFGLCIFCTLQSRKRKRNTSRDTVASSVSSAKPVIEQLSIGTGSPKYFTHIAYPPTRSEQQYFKSSYSKIAEIQKLDKFSRKASGTSLGPGSSGSSSDPICNNNSSSLCESDQLTVTDFYPTSSISTADSSYKPYKNPIIVTTTTSMINEPIWSPTFGNLTSPNSFQSYGFPLYTTADTTNNNNNSQRLSQEIISKKYDLNDENESGYSTPSKTKKTVYEVVV